MTVDKKLGLPYPRGWYVAPDDLPSGVICFSLQLPNDRDFRAAFADLLAVLTNPDAWQDSEDGSVTAQQAADLFTNTTWKGYIEGITCMVAQVVFWPGTLATIPAGTMECAGQSLAVASYPDLFSKLGYAWGGVGANFNLPDMRHRVPMGVGAAGGGFTAHTLGQVLGTETVVLTQQQLASHDHSIPSHGHTPIPHSHGNDAHHHSYDPVVVGDLDIEGPGVPQPNAAQIIPTITENTYDTTITIHEASAQVNDKGSVLTGTRGNGNAHNNMQPSAVGYWIIYVV